MSIQSEVQLPSPDEWLEQLDTRTKSEISQLFKEVKAKDDKINGLISKVKEYSKCHHV